MKKSMVLIELVFTIAIFSIIALYSMNIILNISAKNHTLVDDLENILKLETTKLFLQKHPLSSVKLENEKLIFRDKDLLLDNISKYKVSNYNSLYKIDICLNKDSICQNWIIK